eukprot:2707366-Lingulodinium_polyedra.AAC.1
MLMASTLNESLNQATNQSNQPITIQEHAATESLMMLVLPAHWQAFASGRRLSQSVHGQLLLPVTLACCSHAHLMQALRAASMLLGGLVVTPMLWRVSAIL